MRVYLILLLCFMPFFLYATPQEPSGPIKSDFDLANEAFWQGQYQKAIDLYRSALKHQSQVPELHYNLAMAYASQSQWGYAIFEFEQAWDLDKNPDTKHHLIEARTKAIDFAMKNNPGQRMILADEDDIQTSFLDVLPSLELFGAFLFSLSAILLWRSMQQPKQQAVLRLAAFIVFLISVLFGAIEWSRAQIDQHQYAVVFQHQTQLQKGPGGQYETEALLSAGLKCTIQGEKGHWFRVLLSNGLEGWIDRGHLGVIGRFSGD